AFTPEIAHHFKSINQEWIEDMFEMEETDQAVLNDPQKTIIASGGQVWFARHPELGIIGTCALLQQEPGVFELTKMGVLESARGLKVGEKLLVHVLKEAEKLDLDFLYLLTNEDCKAAIHLYEKLGFEHSEEVMARFGDEYLRSNVAMKYKALP
ncbi:MAG: GNAT family N-acetyltransferase, partial [Planctomycetota bacterium]|nr:GNAT family N-acetyltransferase [Planctomycetota bacterium]